MYSITAAAALLSALLLSTSDIAMASATPECYFNHLYWNTVNTANPNRATDYTLSACCPVPSVLPPTIWGRDSRTPWNGASFIGIDLRDCPTLIGSLPSGISMATNLETIRILNVDMSGGIPDLSPLTKLTHLELSWSGFSGIIPLSSLPSSLTHFDVSGNSFSGFNSAEELSKLSSVTSLDLGNNNFYSQLPPELGDMRSIKTLNIESNLFTGSIPSELTKLSNLVHIKLGNNRFHSGLPDFHTSVTVVAAESDHSYVGPGGSCSGGKKNRCSENADRCNFWDSTCCVVDGGTCPQALDDRTCTTSKNEPLSFNCKDSNFCVEGFHGDGDYGPKGVCCGSTGVNVECVATIHDESSDLWCMVCTGHSSFGLQGCSKPADMADTDTSLPQYLPSGASHLVCKNDVPGGWKTEIDRLKPNSNLKYLSLHGSKFSIYLMENLHEKFKYLEHLDLSAASQSIGREVKHFIVSSNIAWLELQYLNMSSVEIGCALQESKCFHNALQIQLPKLRVLDLSAMKMTSPVSLIGVQFLDTLEELYLNDNGLEALPDNFFNDLIKLTKLRIRGNNIMGSLPNAIYERATPLDCDVPRGATVAGTSSPTTPYPTAVRTKAPTKITANPTKMPTRSPLGENETHAPSMNPSVTLVTSAPVTPTTQSTFQTTSQPTNGKGSTAPAGVASLSAGVVLVAFGVMLGYLR